MLAQHSLSCSLMRRFVPWLLLLRAESQDDEVCPKLCCAEDSTVKVHKLFEEGPLNEVYAIDDALCPDYFKLLREALMGTRRGLYETDTSFPGMRMTYEEAVAAARKFGNKSWELALSAMERSEHL